MSWSKHRPCPAISLWQPWATLIAKGVKTIETRTWAPSRDLHGTRIAIAATGTIPAEAKELLRHTPDQHRLFEAVRDTGHAFAFDGRRLVHDLPLGAVLCTAVLVDVVPMVDRHEPPYPYLHVHDAILAFGPKEGLDVLDQVPFGDFAPGRFAWVLSDVDELFEPVPARGRQGIWNWRPPQLKGAGDELDGPG